MRLEALLRREQKEGDLVSLPKGDRPPPCDWMQASYAWRDTISSEGEPHQAAMQEEP